MGESSTYGKRPDLNADAPEELKAMLDAYLRGDSPLYPTRIPGEQELDFVAEHPDAAAPSESSPTL